MMLKKHTKKNTKKTSVSDPIGMFRKKMGYEPDIKNPKTLSEKVLVRKLYDRRKILVSLTDKIQAKEYIKGKSEALPVPNLHIGVDYKPASFPFIAKPSNYSGETFYCDTEQKWASVKHRYRMIQKKPFGVPAGSWAYSQIPFRVMIEPYLDGIREVKFFCYGGKAKFMILIGERSDTSGAFRPEDTKISYFHRSGEVLDACHRDRPLAETAIPSYIDVDRMAHAAEKLSEGIDFVRLDLIWHEGLIYFGEYTFYPNGGHIIIDPEIYDRVFGKHWRLNI